jgi:RecA-family ATPase
MTVVHDVAEYVRTTRPLPQFYIDNILPQQGTMLLYGSPKVKKSWLVQHMAFCISQGCPWLGFNTVQARTLIAQFEISELSYYWRLRNMAMNFHLAPGWLYEMSPSLMYLEEDRTYERFAELVRPIAPQLIILDCLAACFGGDENDGRDVAKLIEKLALLKDEHHASLIIVHHTNKSIQTTSSVDKARGHSRLAGWVDTLAYMCEQPTGVQIQYKARQTTRELFNQNIVFENHNWTERRTQ